MHQAVTRGWLWTRRTLFSPHCCVWIYIVSWHLWAFLESVKICILSVLKAVPPLARICGEPGWRDCWRCCKWKPVGNHITTVRGSSSLLLEKPCRDFSTGKVISIGHCVCMHWLLVKIYGNVSWNLTWQKSDLDLVQDHPPGSMLLNNVWLHNVFGCLLCYSRTAEKVTSKGIGVWLPSVPLLFVVCISLCSIPHR